MMTAEERYAFDLQGYVVVPQVITPEQVKELRDIANRYHDTAEVDLPPPVHSYKDAGTKSTTARAINGMEYTEPAFQRLCLNHNIMRVVLELTGERPQLLNVASTRNTKDNDTIHFHGGQVGSFLNPANLYQVRDGTCYATFVNVAVSLVDVPPGTGFTCVPGSHQAHFERPADITVDSDSPLVRNVCPKAGDAVIFTEALCHGGRKWTADYPRHTIFVRYCTSYASWSPGYNADPKYADMLTDDLRDLMRPAGFQGSKRVVTKLLEAMNAKA